MEVAAKQAEYLNLSKPTASKDQEEVHVMAGGMAQNFGNKPTFMKGKVQFQRSAPQGKPPNHVFVVGDRITIHIHANLRTKLVAFGTTDDTYLQCVERVVSHGAVTRYFRFW